MQLHQNYTFGAARTHGARTEVRPGAGVAGCAPGGLAWQEATSCTHAGCRPLVSISNVDTFFVPSGAEVLSPICRWSAARTPVMKSDAILSLQTSYDPVRAGNWPKASDFSDPPIITTVVLPAAPDRTRERKTIPHHPFP